MRIINVLGFLIALTVIIDFSESFLYLEKYGYEFELNPFIVDRNSLVFAMALRLSATVLAFMLINFSYRTNNKGIRLARIINFQIVMLVLAFNTAIIVNNLLVMLNA